MRSPSYQPALGPRGGCFSALPMGEVRALPSEAGQEKRGKPCDMPLTFTYCDLRYQISYCLDCRGHIRDL